MTWSFVLVFPLTTILLKFANFPSVILISKLIVSLIALTSTALIFENRYPLFWYKLVISFPSGLLVSAIRFFNKTPL